MYYSNNASSTLAQKIQQGRRYAEKSDPRLVRLFAVTTAIFWDEMGRHIHKHDYIHKNESSTKAMTMRWGEWKHPLAVCDQGNASSQQQGQYLNQLAQSSLPLLPCSQKRIKEVNQNKTSYAKPKVSSLSFRETRQHGSYSLHCWVSRIQTDCFREKLIFIAQGNN